MFETSHGKETLVGHEIPQRPWEKVAVDLFILDQKDYLVTVDYYSGYWEQDRLHSTDVGAVIKKLKSHLPDMAVPAN